MKVALLPAAAKKNNVSGWLHPGREYLVLSVEVAGTGGSAYRIVSDDNATPALFEAELFHLVDTRIPTCWIAVQRERVPLQLMPAAWAEDGFWERFFDGEPEACCAYDDALCRIREDLDAGEKRWPLAASSNVMLKLSRDEARVFFDWLHRFNEATNNDFEDQAEQRVLWNIEAMLESTLVEPFDAKYGELLAAARAKIRDPQGE